VIDWSKSLSAYGRAWNERDRAERIRLLAGALVDDCRYTDTEFDATGPQGVADVIGAYHERFPGFVIRLTSAVDGHHDVIRFAWAYEAMQDGERIEIDGADTILLAHDGRLRQIIVFDGATLPSTEPVRR
jgi:SnoaL-like domain